MFFGVACMDFQVGNTVGAIFTCGTQLFGGFLSTHIPSWLSWMRYLSMVFYAYQNMQIVEFTNGAPFRSVEGTGGWRAAEAHTGAGQNNIYVLQFGSAFVPVWKS